MIKLYFIINHSMARLGHKLESEIFFLPTDVPTKFPPLHHAFKLSETALTNGCSPKWTHFE